MCHVLHFDTTPIGLDHWYFTFFHTNDFFVQIWRSEKSDQFDYQRDCSYVLKLLIHWKSNHKKHKPLSHIKNGNARILIPKHLGDGETHHHHHVTFRRRQPLRNHDRQRVLLQTVRQIKNHNHQQKFYERNRRWRRRRSRRIEYDQFQLQFFRKR